MNKICDNTLWGSSVNFQWDHKRKKPSGTEKNLMTIHGKTTERHRNRSPHVLRVIVLLLAGLSRSRYDFHLLKELEEEEEEEDGGGKRASPCSTADNHNSAGMT